MQEVTFPKIIRTALNNLAMEYHANYTEDKNNNFKAGQELWREKCNEVEDAQKWLDSLQ